MKKKKKFTRKEKLCFVPPSPPLQCHSQGTPLDSKTIWTGDFLSTTIFLKLQNKDDFFFLSLIISTHESVIFFLTYYMKII